MVKADIRPQELPDFFWCHLEKDIELLGRATGKSVDESAIILHLVLRNVLIQDPAKCTSQLLPVLSSDSVVFQCLCIYLR